MESNLDPKVFDAFKLKLEKEEDTIHHHGFKKLIEMENSKKGCSKSPMQYKQNLRINHEHHIR